MNNKNIKKIANSFYEDLQNNLENKLFKKSFYDDLLKLQIANEIVRFRNRQKITQKELASAIKTTQAVISRIENAQVCASTAILQRICSKYRVKVKFEICESVK